MNLDQIILALNTAGTMAIGSITFFIVYTTFKGMQEGVIQEFSKRFLMAIATLLFYVSYYQVYNTFFQGSTTARYPLYFTIVGIFISLIYAALAFEKIADKYGIPEEQKIVRMENKEVG